MRQRWLRDQRNQDLVLEMATLDAGHLRRLKQLLGIHGWPGRSLVGDDGAIAAWMIASTAAPTSCASSWRG